MSARTLYDKLWDEHVVHTEEDGTAVLYIDRHLLHEVTSAQAFDGLRLAGRKVWRASSIVATADHSTPTSGWERGYEAITDPTHQAADRHAGYQHQGLRRRGLLSVPARTAGHRAHHWARERHDAAGHDRGVRRLAHIHARCLWSTCSRHRHERGGACVGDADAAAKKAKNMLVKVEGQLGLGVTAKESSWRSSARSALLAAQGTRSNSPAARSVRSAWKVA